MDETLDVAIVGFGPVGQAMAILLGRAGHRVAAFERFDAIYDLPRAVHFDHEIMRLLQGLGVGDDIADEVLPVREYRWFGADGEPLMTLEPALPALSGWEPDYMFFQPALEAALERRARSLPSVSVERGCAVTGLEQDGDGVTLRAGGRDVRARWVIGADGANSFVRSAVGIERRDLGFAERWLVVDVEPYDMGALDLPRACQWCDPKRPVTHIQSGPRHRRWEFMLLPGEDPADLTARAGELLAPWFGPGDGELLRSTVYEFRSMLAERMRAGRVLLIGDAAHLTPPFLGQGMCSGMRDAANLAWKLDLVLRGRAGDALLDTVDPERQGQNEQIIELAVHLGRFLCELDPVKAGERDAMLRAAGAPAAIELAPLAGGVGRGDDPLAGRLAAQGRLAGDRLLDDVTGGGFTLITRAGDPRAGLGDGQLADLASVGAQLVSLDDDGDGRMSAWLDHHEAHAVLVRPDFYVFGSASTPGDVPALVDDLFRQLEEQPVSVVRPQFHHVNLKTTRLQEMIDWYGELVGAEVVYADDTGAWLSNDGANHRIALLAFPGFADDPDKDTRTGMHHSAFEYGGFEDLNASYLRLRDAGIEPELCLDHGMTLSYYYRDPDGNHVELQVDVFGNWERSREWMSTSDGVRRQPDRRVRRPGARGRGGRVRRWARRDPRARDGGRVRAGPGAGRHPGGGLSDAARQLRAERGRAAGGRAVRRFDRARRARHDGARAAGRGRRDRDRRRDRAGRRAAAAAGARPAEDHLPRPQLPRPRRRGGTGDPGPPAVVREVRELAGRQRRPTSCCPPPTPSTSTTRPSWPSSSGARRAAWTRPTRSTTSPARCRSTTSARATCSSRTRSGRAARRSTRSRPAVPRS